ncbi:hypothetical protein [Nocardia huaxiensis]|uniref:Uncharacterized protein n=1 Tax=Nocardia huaxiensis TaxID=2755382 RepID=A0A7D6VAH1_9NOCA|nr:hypothetical protein [Nocardia huaxiensis]QLY29582.1 hypothetical protein H0264_30725 [Nocardia huaxiensis]UFS96850.1 hypothetical protein LPY97_02655 [Nocardia huaxiensis]
MRKRRNSRVFRRIAGRVSLTLCCLALPTVSVPAGAAPDAAGRTETVIDATGDLTVSRVRMYSPMLSGAAPHPDGCDYIGYLRYRTAGAPEDPQRSDGVVIAQPGAFLGAFSLDTIARNTLTAAAQRGSALEWWSMEPRFGCAFDTTGLAAADAAQDYRLAWDYYFGGKPVDGQRFAGFRPDAELAYLADMGAAQAVTDQYTIMTNELPDPAFRSTRTFCGGHSDGALMTGWFVSWDFGDGQAGYRQCAGLYALESLATSDAVALQDNPFTATLGELGPGATHQVLVDATKSGVLQRSFNHTPGFNPQWWTMVAIAGLAAHYAPDAETELNRLAAGVPELASSFRIMLGGTYLDATLGIGGLERFRFTNTAFLGMLLDDNSLNIGLTLASVGALSGGPIVAKDFPLDDTFVRSIPVVGELLLRSVTGGSIRIRPTDESVLYTWKRFDEIDESVWFTDGGKETVDIRDIARLLATSHGGMVEPYFPFRYEAVDNPMIQLGARDGDLAAMRFDTEARALPTLTVWGTESQEGTLVAPIMPPGSILVPGYHHYDPPYAATWQNDGSFERFATLLAGYVTDRLPR